MRLAATISIVGFFLLALTPATKAQLLEDTEKRLKTVKKERRGFGLFRKKGQSVAPPGSTGRFVAPRSLSFGRTSTGGPVKPRYSSGSPFGRQTIVVRPRFSPGSPFRGQAFRVAPRYSPSKPFSGRDFVVAPRYSPSKPFTKRDLARVSPRYSPGSPFRNQKWVVRPRYSQGMPFTKADFVVAPRYSPGSPFAYKDFKVKPRYTGTMTFNLFVKQVWQNLRPNRYASSSMGPVRVLPQDHSYNARAIASYLGPYKLKVIKAKNLHPSFKYKRATLVSSDFFRESMRKWNLLIVKLNRNKEQPQAVKDKISKPKFDRKEREIWNN